MKSFLTERPTCATGTSERLLCALLLISMAAVFIILRARWIGHTLVWDEAMALCTVRAFVSHGEDYFSDWFWRHPPLFSLLMTLLHPLSDGFAERTESLAILVSCVNMFILFHLNRLVFGWRVALWSAFCLAVMPGAIFYDTWVKTDHTVATFGLLALLSLFHHRKLYASLALGLAILSKDTAVFYAAAIFIIWAMKGVGKRTFQGFFCLTVPAFLSSAWWYLLVANRQQSGSSGFRGITDHLRFALDSTSGWHAPWHYYLKLSPFYIGIAGCILVIIGILLLSFHAGGRRPETDQPEPHSNRVWNVWPLALLLPSILLLSSLPSKVPWIVIALFPAIATLEGLAVAAILNGLGKCTALRPSLMPPLRGLISLIIMFTLACQVCTRNYDDVLRQSDESQWRGATYSRKIAETLNRLAGDNDRILLTSFHYWKGLSPGSQCPVFAYYFKRKAQILIRPHESRFNDLVGDIRKYRLTLAVLSPEPGPKERELFGGFIDELHLKPCRLPKAYIFRTDSLWK